MKHEASPFRDRSGLVWDGSEVVVETTREHHANLGGTIHGGLLMTMLDSVMGGVVIAGLPPEKVAVTASMTTNFLAPGRPGDVLVARACVVKQGRRLAYADGWVTRRGEDTRLATATGTFAIIDRDGRLGSDD